MIPRSSNKITCFFNNNLHKIDRKFDALQTYILQVELYNINYISLNDLLNKFYQTTENRGMTNIKITGILT